LERFTLPDQANGWLTRRRAEALANIAFSIRLYYRLYYNVVPLQ